MTDPENAFLIVFIIDVFSGYFLLEIYPKGVYVKEFAIYFQYKKYEKKYHLKTNKI